MSWQRCWMKRPTPSSRMPHHCDISQRMMRWHGVSVVGPEIRRQEIGFVFQDSPLRKRVGRALIALREDGTYQQIYERWFGSE